MTCNQYKPNISVFIRDTISIKDNKIHEGDPNEALHRFNWEMYTPPVGTAGMLLHIYGKLTKWKLKLSLKRFRSNYDTQVVKRLKMSTLYTSGQKVKNVNIVHKWLKG
jgi:hypothetical protein